MARWVVLASVLVLAGCSGAASPSPSATQTTGPTSGPSASPSFSAEPIVIGGWGGKADEELQKEFGDPFTAATGVQFQFIGAAGEHVARVEAMHQAGHVEWTMINTTAGTDTAYLISKGWVLPLPADVKARLEPVLSPGTVTDYGYTFASTANVIACNAAVAKACPSNPKEFWDTTAFPGPRSMYAGNPMVAMILALEADGVSKDSLYPIDIDRAFKKLDEIKSSIKVWYESGDQQQQTLRDGEVDMGILWDGRAFGLIDQGVNVKVTFDGGVYEPWYMFVLKDGPNQAAGVAFLEWMVTHPDAEAKYMESLGYGIPSPAAFQLMDQKVAARMADNPANFSLTAPIDDTWYLQHKDEVDARWKEFTSGG